MSGNHFPFETNLVLDIHIFTLVLELLKSSEEPVEVGVGKSVVLRGGKRRRGAGDRGRHGLLGGLIVWGDAAGRRRL